jgi:tetratricopeptide (TPR) repeat protein
MRIYRIDQKADNRAAVAGVQGNVSVNKPLAENEFNRAAIYELEFNPLAALPHYETAYRYRPNNSRYGQAYANLLYAEQDFGKAEAIYKNVLAIRRELANPPAYLPDLAATLNILGILYRATQRLKESAEAFTEALQTVF